MKNSLTRQKTDKNNQDALISLLLLQYLKKQQIDQNLLDQLVNELNSKNLLPKVLSLQKQLKTSSFLNIESQVEMSSKNPLETMVRLFKSLTQRKHAQNIKTQFFTDHVHKFYKTSSLNYSKNQTFSKKSKKMMKFLKQGLKKKAVDLFPKYIFTKNFQRLKSILGHLNPDNIDSDNDYLSCVIPMYYLFFSKNGKYFFTGADDGRIKQWDVQTGRLLHTYRGHQKDITLMGISDCNRFIASCCSDNIVRIWDIESRSCLLGFKDHNQKNTYIQFYTNKKDPLSKCYLATTALDGQIKVYPVEYSNPKIIEEKGENGNEEKQLPKGKLGKCIEIWYHYDRQITKQAFSVIEFHPDGYIVGTTLLGAIIIYQKISKIEQDPYKYTKSRISWHEHTKDCHLICWHPNNQLLASGSFDGNVKLWNFNKSKFHENFNRKSFLTINGRINKKRVDIKCGCVLWTKKGSYLLTTFLIESKKEDEVDVTNIIIWSFKQKSIIHTINNTEKKFGFKMEEVQVFEPHPYNEAIAFSGDTSNGIVVIWDIECGLPLNIFQEFGIPVEMPSVELPILDGKWCPDGNSFIVSSVYGTFSIYGFGDNRKYKCFPSQQFFMNDYDHVRINDRYEIFDFITDENIQKSKPTAFCDAWRNYYSQQIFCEGKNVPYHVTSKSNLTLKQLDKFYAYYLETNQDRLEQLATNYKVDTKKLQDIVLWKSKVYLKIFMNKISDQLLKGKKIFKTLKFNEISGSSSRNMKIFGDYGNSENPFRRSSRRGRVRVNQQQRRVPRLTAQISNGNTSTPIRLNILDTLDIQIQEDDSKDSDCKSLDFDQDSDQSFTAQISRQNSVRQRRRLRRLGNGFRNARSRLQNQSNGGGMQFQLNLLLDGDSPQQPQQRVRRSRRQQRRRNQIRISQELQNEFSQPQNYPNINPRYEERKQQQNQARETRMNRRNRRRRGIQQGNSDDEDESDEFEPNKEQEFELSDDHRIIDSDNFQPPNLNTRRSQRIRNSRLNRRSTRNRYSLRQPSQSYGQSSRSTRRSRTRSSQQDIEFSQLDQQSRRAKRRNTSNSNQRRNMLDIQQTALTQQQNSQFFNNKPVCQRCFLPEIQVRCAKCRQNYHKQCSLKRGFKHRGVFVCLACYLQSKRNDPSYLKPSGDAKLLKINREWLDPINKYEEAFFPQTGDEVYYLFQGYEEFLIRYFDWICWDQNEQIIPDIQNVDFTEPILCEVTSVIYDFPRTKDNPQNQLKVVGVYTLRIIFEEQQESKGRNRQQNDEFKVKWFHSFQCKPFLIPRHVFENNDLGILRMLKLQAVYFEEKKLNQLEMYYEKSEVLLVDIQPLDIIFKNSMWKRVKISIPTYQNGRKTEILRYVNPWDLTQKTQQFIWLRDSYLHYMDEKYPQNMQNLFVSKLKEYLTHEQNKEIIKPFLDEIDKEEYKDYYKHVPYETYFEKIINKFDRNQYHSYKGVMQDFELMLYNAAEYNDDDTFIVKNCKKIMVHMTLIMNQIVKENNGNQKDITGQEIEVPTFNSVQSESEGEQLIQKIQEERKIEEEDQILTNNDSNDHKSVQEHKVYIAEIKIGNKVVQEKAYILSSSSQDQIKGDQKSKSQNQIQNQTQYQSKRSSSRIISRRSKRRKGRISSISEESEFNVSEENSDEKSEDEDDGDSDFQSNYRSRKTRKIKRRRSSRQTQTQGSRQSSRRSKRLSSRETKPNFAGLVADQDTEEFEEEDEILQQNEKQGKQDIQKGNTNENVNTSNLQQSEQQKLEFQGEGRRQSSRISKQAKRINYSLNSTQQKYQSTDSNNTRLTRASSRRQHQSQQLESENRRGGFQKRRSTRTRSKKTYN